MRWLRRWLAGRQKTRAQQFLEQLPPPGTEVVRGGHLDTLLNGGHFSCPHLAVSGVIRVTCGICGPLPDLVRRESA